MPRVQVQALIGRGGKLTHRCQAQPTLAWRGMAWRLEHQPTPVSLGAAHDGGRAGEGASEQVACQEPGMPWLVECVGRVGGGLSARHRLASHCTASQPPLCFGQTDPSDKHKRMRSSIEKGCLRNLGNARRAGLRAHARSLAPSQGSSLHRCQSTDIMVRLAWCGIPAFWRNCPKCPASGTPPPKLISPANSGIGRQNIARASSGCSQL